MSGRPSKYETYVKSRFNEIKEWVNLGATEKEIARRLGINKSTLIEYKNKFPELNDLIKENRKMPVEQIKAAMLKKALGFQYTEKKTIKQKVELPDELKSMLDEYGVDTNKIQRPTLIKTEETIKTALPSETAGLILLKHWDKETEWTGDPATLKIKKEELKIKKEQAEKDNW